MVASGHVAWYVLGSNDKLWTLAIYYINVYNLKIADDRQWSYGSQRVKITNKLDHKIKFSISKYVK